MVAAHLAECSYEQKDWKKKKRGRERTETGEQVSRPRGAPVSLPGLRTAALGAPRLNSLSIEGVNLTFQRLDGAAWGCCVLLNLIGSLRRDRGPWAAPPGPQAASRDKESFFAPSSPFTPGVKLPPVRQTACIQRGGGAHGHGEGEKPGLAAPWEPPAVTRRLGMPGGPQGHAEECSLPFLTKDPGSLFTGIE